jgi:hypothetical protein
MKAAILTWYSQVIAVQRKICWHVETARSWRLALRSLCDEADLHGRIIGVKELPKEVHRAATWDELVSDEMNRVSVEIEGATKTSPRWLTHKIHRNERLLAALHGSKFDLHPSHDEISFFEAGSHLVAVASWIGSLKRTGTQVLDEWTARCLCVGWNSIKRGNNCLFGQLPETTWLTLIEVAKTFFCALEIYSQPIPPF